MSMVATMKVEGDVESCCVCGSGEELVSPEEYDAAAPPQSPPLRAVLARLAGGAGPPPAGRLCGSCLQRALEAHEFATSLRARAPAPLSERVRALRRRLAELTERIDVFIVVGGKGGQGGTRAYSEDDIIMVERGALSAAAEPAHGRNARGDSVYQCSVCPLSFLSAAEYRAHASSHPADAVHSCWTCGAQFSSRQKLHNHVDQEHDAAHTTCYVCNTNFQSELELSRHTPLCPSVCPSAGCPARCPDRSALSAHVRSAHSLLCPTCYRPLPAPDALSAHMLTHRHSRHYVCGYGDCVLRFPNRSNLMAHIRKCHAPEVNPLTCQHCQRTYATPQALKRHEKVHATQELVEEVVVETAEGQDQEGEEMEGQEEIETEGEGAVEMEEEGEVEYLEVETLEDEPVYQFKLEEP